MNRRGRILVEHNGESTDFQWETSERDGAIEVRYRTNGVDGARVAVGDALYEWINGMIMADVMEHIKELAHADTATEGFPDVEPISARAKAENDVN